MPMYKHPCPYCGQFIEGDAKVCPYCATRHPFTPYRCPACGKIAESGEWRVCQDCGAPLRCPSCGARIGPDRFVCSSCGIPLRCPKCKAFVEVGAQVCWDCGMPLKCPKCATIVVPASLKKCVKCGVGLRQQEPSPKQMGLPKRATPFSPQAAAPQAAAPMPAPTMPSTPTPAAAPVTPASGDAAKCVSCGAALKPGAKFCADCGKPVVAQAISACPACGSPAEPGLKFCTNCGKILS